ncbi:MAG: FAD-binding oxidoreductase [Magnetovibrio sp.]|nr:FAD-binding oxidoreductase [Magnetovibrio sp.]
MKPEQALTKLLGEKSVIVETDAMRPYVTEWRGVYTPKVRAVILPKNTQEVARTVRFCADEGIPLTPQGGNTGLVGATAPEHSDGIILNLGRMNTIRKLDTIDNAAIVEAGVILQILQQAAGDAGRMFPLRLGSEGSAQVGGLIATNAGGAHAARYGMMREQVLGLEVVLPDGSILDGLSTLRKNNTGPDLKHLFIGSEGAFGIVTAAGLRLVPRPVARRSLLVAFETIEQGLNLLHLARSLSGDNVEVFDFISRTGIEFATRHVQGVHNPLSTPSPWVGLIELTGANEEYLEGLIEQFIEKSFEADLLIDGVQASSDSQRQQFWKLREAVSEGQRAAGPELKHDIAVPLRNLADFICEASNAVANVDPNIMINPFGHIGDGNVHFNLTLDAATTCSSTRDTLSQMIFAIAHGHDGTFSAEHGIGRLKENVARDWLSAPHRKLVGDLKKTLDPMALMSPAVLRWANNSFEGNPQKPHQVRRDSI